MKNLFLIVWTAVISCSLFLSGCSEKTSEEKQAAPQIESTDNEKMSEDTENQTFRGVTIYYVDDRSGSIAGKPAEIQNEFDIWSALKENGILTEECELNSIRINDDQTMDLDFNQATADRINSMGTTGETEIIGCIINTYLDAYDCEGIRLLDNGENFVSSHGAEFDKYWGRIEF